MLYAVILAGGSGTRLWPLSREAHPKQFLKFFEDKTMFQLTVERILPVFPPENILIVTPEKFVSELNEQVPGIPRENFIVEPQGRGTAAAIGLAAIHLLKKDNADPIMAVLTADHYIGLPAVFCKVLAAAAQVAQSDRLVTLGITPTEPNTGYGYIKQAELIDTVSGFDVFRVERFLEKPGLEQAKVMTSSPGFTWNSGMFIWRVATLMSEFARQMPNLFHALNVIGSSIGSDEYADVLNSEWQNIEKQTIDYGIMEGAEKVAVIPVSINWTDVGDWGSLHKLLPADQNGNDLIGNVVAVDAKGSLIYGGKRLITLIGVEDLVVIDSEDALLICKSGREQDVKKLVELLKEQGKSEHL